MLQLIENPVQKPQFPGVILTLGKWLENIRGVNSLWCTRWKMRFQRDTFW